MECSCCESSINCIHSGPRCWSSDVKTGFHGPILICLFLKESYDERVHGVARYTHKLVCVWCGLPGHIIFNSIFMLSFPCLSKLYCFVFNFILPNWGEFVEGVFICDLKYVHRVATLHNLGSIAMHTSTCTLVMSTVTPCFLYGIMSPCPCSVILFNVMIMLCNSKYSILMHFVHCVHLG